MLSNMEELKNTPIENQETASERFLTVCEADRENLCQVAKWQRITAVITVISAAFAFILSLALIIWSSDIAFYISYFADLGGGIADLEMMEDIMSVSCMVAGIICLIASLLYIPAVVYMLRASRSAKTAVENNDIGMLQESLKNNRSLSKFIGICIIVALALIPVLFLAGVIIGVALAA